MATSLFRDYPIIPRVREIILLRTLSLLQYDVEHLLDRFPSGTKDVEWLEYVGKNKLALITKDKQIRRRPNEKALLIKYKVVAFYLGGSKRNVQDIAKQLMKAWVNMQQFPLWGL